jgi:GNAT superfamily N-acetyltransferase
MMVPDLTFRRYDAAGARQIRPTVESVFKDSYAEAISSGDPFDSVEAFMQRFDAYTSRGSFDMVVGYDGDDSVGQAWGWPLDERAGKGWWVGLDPEPGFTREDGKRTFALSEIMVCSNWTGQGVAHALHDELLSGRNEQRATLLVEPDNDTAYRAYLRWGWRKVAQLRPSWPGAPLFDVLILPLPVRSRS